MYSKETDNYKLPQWVPTDHPDFLTDMNYAMRTIDDTVHRNEVDGKALKEDLDAIAVHVDELDNLTKELKEKVDSLVELDQNPTFIALKERVDAAETDIANLKTRMDANDITVGQIQASITSINTHLDTIDHTLEDHTTELEDHHNSITSILNEQATIREKLGDLQNDIDLLERQVDDNTANIAKNTNDIAEVKGNITNLTEQVAELNSTVEQEKGKNADIPKMKGEGWDALPDDQKPSLMSLKEQIGQGGGTTDPDIAKMKGAGWDDLTDAQKPSLMSLKTEQDSEHAMIETLQDDMVQAKADITGLQTVTQGQQTAIQNLTGRVGDLEGGGTGTTENIYALSIEISTKLLDQGAPRKVYLDCSIINNVVYLRWIHSPQSIGSNAPMNAIANEATVAAILKNNVDVKERFGTVFKSIATNEARISCNAGGFVIEDTYSNNYTVEVDIDIPITGNGTMHMMGTKSNKLWQTPMNMNIPIGIITEDL